MDEDPALITLAWVLAFALFVLLSGIVLSAPAGATANETSSDPIDDWMNAVEEDQSEEDDSGLLSRVKNAIGSAAPQSAVNGFAALDGQLDRYISNPLADPPRNEEVAKDFERAVQANNKTLESEINSKTEVTTDFDTHAIIIAHEDSDPVSVFLVGDVNNGTISNLQVLDRDTFNATNRTVDEHWVVDGDAATNLPQITETIAERIQNREEVGSSYQSRLGGRYCSAQAPWSGDIADLKNCDVRSTVWLPDEEVQTGGTDG